MLMATQSPATVVFVTAIMLLLDIFAVGLRYLARRRKRQPIQADDWFCVVSLILAFGLAIALFIGVAQKALAYPTPVGLLLRSRTALTTSNEKVIIAARIQYIFLVVSVPTLGAIKLSVLCFYRRIFVVDKTNIRDSRNLLYIVMMVIVGLWTGGFLFSFMFACKGHFSAWWTSAISLITTCVNTLELFFAFAVSDFITDCIILVLPIPQIWKLRLPAGRKVGVLLIFMLGVLATVASLIRMIWVIWARKVGFNVSLDEDLLITTSLFWNMVEVSIGIVASCLPTLRGLFQQRSIDSFVHSLREKMYISSWSTPSSSENSVRLTDIQTNGSKRELDFITVAGNR